jgi:hypothetical protein
MTKYTHAGSKHLFSRVGHFPCNVWCDSHLRKILAARDFWGEVDRGPGREEEGRRAKKKEWCAGMIGSGTWGRFRADSNSLKANVVEVL